MVRQVQSTTFILTITLQSFTYPFFDIDSLQISGQSEDLGNSVVVPKAPFDEYLE
jgi:hypothetical protein